MQQLTEVGQPPLPGRVFKNTGGAKRQFKNFIQIKISGCKTASRTPFSFFVLLSPLLSRLLCLCNDFLTFL